MSALISYRAPVDRALLRILLSKREIVSPQDFRKFEGRPGAEPPLQMSRAVLGFFRGHGAPGRGIGFGPSQGGTVARRVCDS
jgi:hypothetical protein